MKYKILFILTLLVLSISTTIKTKNYTVTNNLKTNSNMSKILEKYDYSDGHYCNKVRVISVDGSAGGSFNLEDYVAGVVSGETHILNDEETFKAMSIAIRTYTLYVTNNCKYPILNSEANQVMDRPSIVSNKIKKTVSETKGKILTLDGKLVKSEYDSFYQGNGYHCDRKFCYSKYLKVGNKNTKPKSHIIKVPSSWQRDFSGGHGKGMSQYGAKYLANQGYNYEQILKYFYADGVKISTTIKPNLDGLDLDETGFITRISRPKRNNEYFYDIKNDAGINGNLEGDSNWYITGRSNEILKANNNSRKFSPNIKIEDYCKLSDFIIEYDYQKPKKGSIISWGKHAAIIENVSSSTVDITEAYIGLGYYGIGLSNEILLSGGDLYNSSTNKNDRKYNCEENNSGCFKRSEILISELNKRWGYDFKCYVNLID